MRYAAILILACASLVSCSSSSEEPAAKPAKAETKQAETPPALQITDWFNAQPMTLEGLKGKVVVIDFWNIYCGPCRKLMPHLGTLYTEHKAEGLVVIGITDDVKKELEAFLAKNPVSYPIAIDKLVDGEGQTGKAYGIVALPTIWLIGRDGNVVWKGPGRKLTDAMVLAELASK
jgi:thiol-disulfide isomerase/thioredoxin